MSPRLVMILAAALSVLAAAAGLYWKGRHDGVARERPRTEAAQTQAAVAGLEAEGARQSARATEAAVGRRDAAAGTVATLSIDALKSEDAHALLAPDRGARLRDADRQLCHTAPELAGCSAN